MKIAFWSKEPNSRALSAGITAVAYMTAAYFGHRSLIFHSGFTCHELEHAFVEPSDTLLLKEELAYFYDSGIDLILNRLRFEGLGTTGVREQMLTIKKGLLYYLPGSTKANREIYEEMFAEKGKEAFELLAEMFEVLFIACGGDINMKVNRLVLEEADVIVVLCEQIPPYNKDVVEEVLSFGKKIVFLVGMYDKESKYTVKDIQKELRVKRDSLGVILYNISFLDSLTDGSVVTFMEKALKSKKKESKYSFVNEAADVTKKILQKAGLYEEKK